MNLSQEGRKKVVRNLGENGPFVGVPWREGYMDRVGLGKAWLRKGFVIPVGGFGESGYQCLFVGCVGAKCGEIAM